MKFFVAAVVAATLALSSADTACDVTLLAPQAENPDVIQCSADSGFTVVPPTIPAADVIAKICTSSACLNSLAALESFGLGDCLLLDTLHLETDLIDPIKAACNSTTGSSSSSGSAADNSTITVPSGSSKESGSSSNESDGDPEDGSSSASGSVGNGAPHQTAALVVATTSLAAAVALYL